MLSDHECFLHTWYSSLEKSRTTLEWQEHLLVETYGLHARECANLLKASVWWDFGFDIQDIYQWPTKETKMEIRPGKTFDECKHVFLHSNFNWTRTPRTCSVIVGKFSIELYSYTATTGCKLCLSNWREGTRLSELGCAAGCLSCVFVWKNEQWQTTVWQVTRINTLLVF